MFAHTVRFSHACRPHVGARLAGPRALATGAPHRRLANSAIVRASESGETPEKPASPIDEVKDGLQAAISKLFGFRDEAVAEAEKAKQSLDTLVQEAAADMEKVKLELKDGEEAATAKAEEILTRLETMADQAAEKADIVQTELASMEEKAMAKAEIVKKGLTEVANQAADMAKTMKEELDSVDQPKAAAEAAKEE